MDEAGLCFPTQRESFRLRINFSKAPGGPGRGGKGGRHMASSSSLPRAGEQHYGYLESLLATCRHLRIPTTETPQMEPSSTGSPAGLCSLPQLAVPQGGFMEGLAVLPAPHCPPAEHPLRGASPPLCSACCSSCLAFPRCSDSLPKAPAGAGRNLTENSVRADRSQARTERRARGQASSRASGMPSSCL